MTDDNFLYPINIGQWRKYSDYVNEEQKELQLSSLFALNVDNDFGPLRMIYSKYIHELNETVTRIASEIHITDTDVVLEDEIYHTAKIEGAKTTRIRTSELHNGSPIDQEDAYSERMVKNGFDAVKLLNLYGNRLNRKIIHAVWDTLTDGCRDNQNIQGSEFRIAPVYVGTHEGAKFEKIPHLMDKWLTFYNNDELNDFPFIKAAILHFAFESIHPFCDGNGRLGRLLMNNYLIGQGIETARAVSFSKHIDATRAQYDAALSDGENTQNDITPFIGYMLDTMADAFYSAKRIQEHNTDPEPER